MILPNAKTQIWLATKPADFRCGIDGFAALCQSQLKKDPRSGHWFVFINRNRTMLRVLCYDMNGYCLLSKRLTKGRFATWPTHENAVTPVMAKMFMGLFYGVSGWHKVA